MRIVVSTEKCTGCEACIDSCPYTAIEMREGKAFINEYCQFCRACMSICPEGVIKEVLEVAEMQASVSHVEGYRGIWVFAEQRNGKVAPVAYELLGAGRRLADERRTELSAVLFGGAEPEAEGLIHWGADRVYFSNAQIFGVFNDEPYSQLLSLLIQEHHPEVVLAGATPIGDHSFPA